MVEIIHPHLSYKIMGVLFKVYNKLGGGYQEKYYKRAVRKELIEAKLPFLEQVRVDLDYANQFMGRYYLDFVIDHKIVLELKVSPRFSRRDIMQVLGYLKKSGLELGILVSMNRNDLSYKRILKGNSLGSSSNSS